MVHGVAIVHRQELTVAPVALTTAVQSLESLVLKLITQRGRVNVAAQSTAVIIAVWCYCDYVALYTLGPSQECYVMHVSLMGGEGAELMRAETDNDL